MRVAKHRELGSDKRGGTFRCSAGVRESQVFLTNTSPPPVSAPKPRQDPADYKGTLLFPLLPFFKLCGTCEGIYDAAILIVVYTSVCVEVAEPVPPSISHKIDQAHLLVKGSSAPV